MILYIENPDSILKSTGKTLLTKVHLVKAMIFLLVMYRWKSWIIKKAEHWGINWCFWTVVLEKTLENPLDSREIKPVNPKENQPWTLIGRTDAEAPIFWPPDVKSLLIRKVPSAGKDWRQKEKGATDDEMVGWHPRLNRHEFEQAPEDSEGEGSLVCYNPWSCKKSDRT